MLVVFTACLFTFRDALIICDEEMQLLHKSHPFVVVCSLKLTLGLYVLHRLVDDVDYDLIADQILLLFINNLN